MSPALRPPPAPSGPPFFFLICKKDTAQQPDNSFQLSTPDTPLRARYVSPPYGMLRHECEPGKDLLTVSFEGFEQKQLDFLERLDRLVSQHCQTAFKRQARPLLKEGVLKAKLPHDISICDADNQPLTVDDIQSGDSLVPILRISSLWCGGGECGAALKVVRLMRIAQRTPTTQEEIDWAW